MATSFALNISEGGDHGLHMNVRFNAHGDERVVVYNSYLAGTWGEEVREGGFPFNHEQPFTVHFPNRLSATKFMNYSVNGQVKIHGFNIQ
ncbi:hypothetical protein CRUP_002186 [Coryphaenoides rupestris]|nr:hypothetical protein CRUP_002186 [Coryphaenoides rupestris]